MPVTLLRRGADLRKLELAARLQNPAVTERSSGRQRRRRYEQRSEPTRRSALGSVVQTLPVIFRPISKESLCLEEL